MIKQGRNIVTLMLTVSLVLILSTKSYGKCESTFINPITDICWQCIFPIVIGGVEIIDSDVKPDLHMDVDDPLCVCKDGQNIILGLRVGLFEPARLVETVKDPYCFVLLGMELDNSEGGFLGGSSTDKAEGNGNGVEETTFVQAHWYIFPAFAILDLFVDFPCFEDKEFGIGYFTEIDDMWNDDITALLVFPETLLFANPIAALSCVADSIATSVAGEPINSLFWCMGSWGTAYPMSGHLGNGEIIEANATAAARMIYKLGRESLLWDTGSDVCGAILSPMWKKNHYRMHSIKPVRDKTCRPIGKSTILWGSGKNPPFGSEGNAADNFAWMIFRKNLCCAGYSF